MSTFPDPNPVPLPTPPPDFIGQLPTLDPPADGPQIIAPPVDVPLAPFDPPEPPEAPEPVEPPEIENDGPDID
jgi:hypothetical protein